MLRIKLIALGLALLSGSKICAKYYSQIGQDKYVYEHFFKNKKDGVFLDIGASDGREMSNSLFFEETMGWNGICIEPRPDVFRVLEQNRTCICVNCCIGAESGEQDFLLVTGYAGNLSGLLSEYDPKHIARIDRELEQYGGTKEVIKVPTLRLNDLLREHGITKVDYCSIDTEGNELSILKSINFDEVDIDIIDVENNYGSNVIRKYLESQGYEFVGKVKWDDIYRKKRN